MKSLFLVLGILPLHAHADPFPGTTVVRCRLQSTINQAEQPIATLEFDVSRLGSCESGSREFALPRLPLRLGISYAAACQRPGSSFPEHLGSLNITGPRGSSIYSSASTFGGFSSFLGLQLTTALDGSRYNVLAHCRIERP